MAKKTAATKATSKTRAKVVRPVRAKPSAAAVQAAAKIVTEAAQEQPTALWEVLAPFKFNGTVIKPPSWIALSADDAALYQAHGVLGAEPGELPDTEATGEDGAADAPAGNVAAGSATDGQG